MLSKCLIAHRPLLNLLILLSQREVYHLSLTLFVFRKTPLRKKILFCYQITVDGLYCLSLAYFSLLLISDNSFASNTVLNSLDL